MMTSRTACLRTAASYRGMLAVLASARRGCKTWQSWLGVCFASRESWVNLLPSFWQEKCSHCHFQWFGRSPNPLEMGALIGGVAEGLTLGCCPCCGQWHQPCNCTNSVYANHKSLRMKLTAQLDMRSHTSHHVREWQPVTDRSMAVLGNASNTPSYRHSDTDNRIKKDSSCTRRCTARQNFTLCR